MRPFMHLVAGLSFSVFLVAAISTPARGADDRTFYPASFCHTLGGASYNFEDVYYSVGYGDATNDEAASRNVVCPVASHHSSCYTTGHWVVVASTSTTIYCYLCRRDQISGSGGCGASDYSYYKNGSPELLAPEASWTSSTTYGAAWFYCTLPSSGSPRIISYAYNENG